MSDIPEDIFQTACGIVMEAKSLKSMLRHKDVVDAIAVALLAERERSFDSIQAAYRSGVDFACEGAGVVDDDYVELWKYVPKAAYDYADKATGGAA